VIEQKSYQPKLSGDLEKIRAAIDLMAGAKRPIIYSGGGVINSGREASQLLRELVELTGFPITSTLMGLGAYPASGKNWMGMLGMHGTYEANMAMHDCDVMICIGARFDDRITGRLDAFSPNSKKIHIDIDPVLDQQECPHRYRHSRRCRPCSRRHGAAVAALRRRPTQRQLADWWTQIAKWKGRNSLAYRPTMT
jgi:acetolactate synthase-1/2/3 large subunit